MEKLHALLHHHYDIVPTSVQVVRNIWKVTSDKGAYAVKKCSSTPEHFQFVHHGIQYLRQSGFSGVLPYVQTRDGLPYAHIEGGLLYVVPWIEGSSGKDLLNHTDWLDNAFTQLGSMHRIGMGKYTEQLDTLYREGQQLQENWSSRIHRLNEFREVANKRVYPSPIDVVFMANIDEMLEMAIEATGRLEEWLKSTEEADEIRLTFCHGRLHTEHMILAEQFYVINFDHANLDFPARDLSYLIRHLSARMGDAAMIEGWMNRYVRENSLTNEEYEILNISLQYPTMLIHFLERYYTQQLAGKWTELTLVRRFEKMIYEQNLLQHI